MFIRAAEVSAAVSRRGPHAFVGIPDDIARACSLLYIRQIQGNAGCEHAVRIFELKNMLIFIDGLNETVDNRCLVEESIDGQVETIPSG